jgi:hypothetical protein
MWTPSIEGINNAAQVLLHEKCKLKMYTLTFNARIHARLEARPAFVLTIEACSPQAQSLESLNLEKKSHSIGAGHSLQGVLEAALALGLRPRPTCSS